MTLSSEDKAVLLYNEACDMLQGSDGDSRTSTSTISELLTCAIQIISDMHAHTTPLPGASSCVLLARACILYGQLVEWKDDAIALENYNRAIEVDPSNPEAHVQAGRCMWKSATSLDMLKVVEERLRHAISLCDAGEDEGESFCESDAVDPTLSEANNLLARLLSQSPGREDETKALLADIGYKYTLSHWMTSSSTAPESTSSCRKTSKRLQNSNVCAFDEVLPPPMLEYMQKSFASDSSFWPEHGYDSPTSGFFSYQLPLVSPVVCKGPSPLASFESVVHSIWTTAQRGMPKLRDAKFAEWWCHSRPHCNGHKMHYDFVTDDGTEPRFPIASTVTFVTADCGGPTLVTDQRVAAASPLTHQGWLVHPAANRLVCFDGSLLHCVLPGQGPSPSSSARRVTFMVAFWEEDPRAPHTPVPGRGGGRGRREEQWPRLLARPMGSIEKTDAPPLPNSNAVVLVDQVVERVFSPEGPEGVESRRAIKQGVDLLEDDVFTYFEALNSGLVLSAKSICSLNCGGTCALCRGESEAAVLGKRSVPQS